jgi:hypothetical protein
MSNLLESLGRNRGNMISLFFSFNPDIRSACQITRSIVEYESAYHFFPAFIFYKKYGMSNAWNKALNIK